MLWPLATQSSRRTASRSPPSLRAKTHEILVGYFELHELDAIFGGIEYQPDGRGFRDMSSSRCPVQQPVLAPRSCAVCGYRPASLRRQRTSYSMARGARVRHCAAYACHRRTRWSPRLPRPPPGAHPRPVHRTLSLSLGEANALKPARGSGIGGPISDPTPSLGQKRRGTWPWPVRVRAPSEQAMASRGRGPTRRTFMER